jgi:prepilin-type processing-associated H-X9-DG protein
MFYYILFFLQIGFFQVAANAAQNQFSYPFKPASVHVTRGMISSLTVDGKDVTSEIKKLIAYTVDWNYGKLGEYWTNVLFQFDPKKGVRKECSAHILFADGSVQDWRWKENEVKVGNYRIPFIVLEAVYGAQGGFCDVTRHFQLGMKARITGDAIKTEKDPAIKASLTTLFGALGKSKNIMLALQGEAAAKPVSFRDLLQGWSIETTSLFPGSNFESAQGQKPAWSKVLATDRVLARVSKSLEEQKKDRLAAADLPANLKVMENQNNVLLDETKKTDKKKK